MQSVVLLQLAPWSGVVAIQRRSPDCALSTQTKLALLASVAHSTLVLQTTGGTHSLNPAPVARQVPMKQSCSSVQREPMTPGIQKLGDPAPAVAAAHEKFGGHLRSWHIGTQMLGPTL